MSCWSASHALSGGRERPTDLCAHKPHQANSSPINCTWISRPRLFPASRRPPRGPCCPTLPLSGLVLFISCFCSRASGWRRPGENRLVWKPYLSKPAQPAAPRKQRRDGSSICRMQQTQTAADSAQGEVKATLCTNTRCPPTDDPEWGEPSGNVGPP